MASNPVVFRCFPLASVAFFFDHHFMLIKYEKHSNMMENKLGGGTFTGGSNMWNRLSSADLLSSIPTALALMTEVCLPSAEHPSMPDQTVGSAAQLLQARIGRLILPTLRPARGAAMHKPGWVLGCRRDINSNPHPELQGL